MSDYKTILGSIAVIMALISYVPYIRNIFLSKTKPHAYSWLVWGALTTIAFLGQVTDNGGPGTWVTGFTSIICLSIFVLALVKGEKYITLSDKLSLFGAIIALFFWLITANPIISVILITIIDALGFYPTFRKSYMKPHEETTITYVLSGLKFIIAIVALSNYSVVTWLYPASLVIMNLGFVCFVQTRKFTLAKF